MGIFPPFPAEEAEGAEGAEEAGGEKIGLIRAVLAGTSNIAFGHSCATLLK